MHDALLIAGAIAVGYLIGTFPTAVLVTRLVTHGRTDIRAAGSGNPGGMNTATVLGTGWGVVVTAIDAGKGVLGGLAGWWIGGPDAAFAGATSAVAGHIFPVWSRFRGGKGVATSAGGVLAVFPAVFPIEAVAALLGVAAFRNAERAAQIGCVVWLSTSIAWWLADLPNLWGPAPTIALPISQTIGAALIVGKFYEARVHAQLRARRG